MKTLAELEAQAIIAMQEKIDHLREEIKNLESGLECVGWIDQRGFYYKGKTPPEDKNCAWRPVYTRRKECQQK